MQITPDLISSHGLTPEEYRQIESRLGRTPTFTELGIFSVMWSEHCSYKSSRVHLKKLPTSGSVVIQGPGENAGVVDLGNGLAAVFKIESHNHPSFIEPYQGAATGVGGIIRDIFTMGARPMALMNSLHFGPLQAARNQLTLEGVVAGIAGYGNCMGIPTVGGEVYFQENYGHNPIVNVFCLGIAPAEKIFYASASGVGNPVIYVGARTGKDGIHGATMASEEFRDGEESKRPTVQVGDPFLEKLLLEACLEAMQSGGVVGISDMGAAGLTCSSCEMGSRSGQGVEIDLELVPQREAGMSAYEIMLSESQERMLLVAREGHEDGILRIFEKWDLEAVVIGRVRSHGNLVVHHQGRQVAEVPNRALTDEAPVYRRAVRPPTTTPSNWQTLDPGEPQDYNQVLLDLSGSPHLCSRRWVYRQYDHQVRTDTVVLPGSDAAVLRLKKGKGAVAMTLDGNPRFCRLDPRAGTILAVAESCRNLTCCGARPLAATNCLNFASPENENVMWQFRQSVEGMAEACRHFNTPVTGGNVSFYNETNQTGIWPTPVIGMVGRIDNLESICRAHFRQPGDTVYLVGPSGTELGGSIYLETRGLPLLGPCPGINLTLEKKIHDHLRTAIQQRLVQSAHDISEGGLAFTLAECCFQLGLGFKGEVTSEVRPDLELFSEAPSRVVASVSPKNESAFENLMADLPWQRLGQVQNHDFQLECSGRTLIKLPVSELFDRWDSFLEGAIQH